MPDNPWEQLEREFEERAERDERSTSSHPDRAFGRAFAYRHAARRIRETREAMQSSETTSAASGRRDLSVAEKISVDGEVMDPLGLAIRAAFDPGVFIDQDHEEPLHRRQARATVAALALAGYDLTPRAGSRTTENATPSEDEGERPDRCPTCGSRIRRYIAAANEKGLAWCPDSFHDRPDPQPEGERVAELELAIRRMCDELGVPHDATPAPVANAVQIAEDALSDGPPRFDPQPERKYAALVSIAEGGEDVCATCLRPESEHAPGPASPPRIEGHLGTREDRPAVCGDFRSLAAEGTERLRVLLSGPQPNRSGWRIVYGDQERVAGSYDGMRSAVHEIVRARWGKAGEPLDPAWPASGAEEHKWEDAEDGSRRIDLPDGTSIIVHPPDPQPEQEETDGPDARTQLAGDDSAARSDSGPDVGVHRGVSAQPPTHQPESGEGERVGKVYVVESEGRAFLPEQINLPECRRQGYEVREYAFKPTPELVPADRLRAAEQGRNTAAMDRDMWKEAAEDAASEREHWEATARQLSMVALNSQLALSRRAEKAEAHARTESAGGQRLYNLLALFDTRNGTIIADLVQQAREGYERSHPDMGEDDAWAAFDSLWNSLTDEQRLAAARTESERAEVSEGFVGVTCQSACGRGAEYVPEEGPGTGWAYIDGEWRCEECVQQALNVARRAADEVEARLRAFENERCAKHAAHNPEGDCVLCDKELADERAEEAVGAKLTAEKRAEQAEERATSARRSAAYWQLKARVARRERDALRSSEGSE